MPNPVRKLKFTHKKKGKYNQNKAAADNGTVIDFQQIEICAADLGFTKALGLNEFLILEGEYLL